MKLSDKKPMDAVLRLRVPGLMMKDLNRVATKRASSASAVAREAIVWHVQKEEESEPFQRISETGCFQKQKLDRIIDEVTSRTLVGSVSVTIEKMAEEIAKETLSDEEFREALHALVRTAAKRIMAELTEAQTE
jgi:hypothetical protein